MARDPKQECPEVIFSAPSAKIGGTIKVPPCLPAPIISPDALKEPPGLPPGNSFGPDYRPEPLSIGNDEQTAECALPSTGTPVIIAVDTYRSELYWESIENMTEEILAVIDGKGGEYEPFLSAWASGNLTEAFLRGWIGALPPVSTSIIAAFTNAKNSLNSQATYAAQAALVCLFYNEEVTAYCPEGVATQDEYYPAVPFFTVAAGTFSSSTSVEDANRKAYTFATSQLLCKFPNDVVTVTCQDIPGWPVEPVPVDRAPVYQGLERRVGSFQVAPNQFFSDVSREAATETARTYAIGMLNCYYVNDEIVIQCDPSKGDPYPAWANDPSTPPETANVQAMAKGQKVIIPQGFIVSDLGTAEANQMAQMLAESLRECCYLNKTYTAECPPQTVVLPSGETVVIPADPEASSPSSYVVLPGTFNSCVSQEEADAMAKNFGDSILKCMYCNLIVLPTCTPQWVIDGVLDGSISLPLVLDELRDPVTGGPVDYSSWSDSATLGTPEGVYCSEDYQQSQSIADSVGMTTVESLQKGDGCEFSSDAIIVGCAVVDPKPSSEPHLFFSKYAADSWISRESTPSAGTHVVLAAGAVVTTADMTPGTLPKTDPNYDKDVNDALTKAYANELAMELAKSLLNCWFTNEHTEVSCDGTLNTIGTRQELWKYSAGLLSQNLTRWSTSSASPGVIPYGTLVSDISLADISSQTTLFAQSLLQCQYFNDAQSAACPPDMIQLNAGTIMAGTVVSSSRKLANQMAQQMAYSALACLAKENSGGGGGPGKDGKDGAPGESGAQENCEGKCFGFWS